MAARYARKTGFYLGICYGLYAVVIDVARNCVGLAGAHSAEISEKPEHPVIALITEWTDEEGTQEKRGEDSDGGTMRLVNRPALLIKDHYWEVYGTTVVRERHRHRYEVNNNYCRPESRIENWWAF